MKFQYSAISSFLIKTSSENKKTRTDRQQKLQKNVHGAICSFLQQNRDNDWQVLFMVLHDGNSY